MKRFKTIGDIQMTVTRGRRTGMYFGNKTYIWYGVVYRKGEGKLWSGKVEKTISWKHLMIKAGINYKSMTTVLITTPANLTKAEADLWDWATGAMEDAFGDADFMRDNPDMVTAEGQLDDMKYRVGEQAVSMAGDLLTHQAESAAIRVAKSLMNKMELL